MIVLFFAVLSAASAALLLPHLPSLDGIAALGGFLLIGLCAFLLLSLLWIAGVVIFSCTVDQSRPAGQGQGAVRAVLAQTIWLLFALCRVRVRVRGRERIPREGRYLFTSNHISIFDPLASLAVLWRYGVTFVSKKENMSRPVIGNLMHAAGMLSIDRENDRSAVRTIVQATKLMKDDRVSIGLYPEGYTNRDANTVLQPFRDGSLKTAQRAGVPVLVAVIRGTRQIRFPQVLLRPWTVVTLEFLELISAQEVSALSTHELGERIWTTMYRALTEER